ncbi:MAG TPA: hypothetical protein VEA79_14030, partial [Phenylobacterium sp.]|nr:hypothetical protein [Phenylobacterium sp.]
RDAFAETLEANPPQAEPGELIRPDVTAQDLDGVEVVLDVARLVRAAEIAAEARREAHHACDLAKAAFEATQAANRSDDMDDRSCEALIAASEAYGAALDARRAAGEEAESAAALARLAQQAQPAPVAWKVSVAPANRHLQLTSPDRRRLNAPLAMLGYLRLAA